MTLTIDITIDHDAWSALGDLSALARRAVEAALAAASAAIPADAELSIVLADDAFVRQLNRRWRGKDQATNVLSFPASEPMLGDIVVAHETCAREAADEGRSLDDHLAHMLVHGVFHLVGFDHEDDAQAETMERLEAEALARLGIASPYEAAPAEAAPAEAAPAEAAPAEAAPAGIAP